MRPADLVVIVAAGLLVGASWAALWSGGGAAEYAEISAPDAAPQRLALAADTVVEITGRLGASIIEVRGGRVRFNDSPCVGRQCVHAGWLSRSGQVAACLPNGVVVEVAGGRREFDAVSF
nr:NusG domain II-containing protein [Thioalkalivibrio sp. XN279]